MHTARWWVGLVVVAVAAAAAAAPSLARTRTALLGGRLEVRLADGMSTNELAAGASLDWGDVRFWLVARWVGKRADVRDGLAIAGCARVERLARRTWGAGPAMPPRTAAGVLVYAAVAVALDGDAAQLAFYVDPDAIDAAPTWAALARAIAATAQLATAPPRGGPPDRAVAVAAKPRAEVPRAPTRLPLARGCTVRAGELDVHAAAPDDASHVLERLRGVPVYWNIWRDRAGLHQEVTVGAARWGWLHVTCRAATERALAAQRRAIERAYP